MEPGSENLSDSLVKTNEQMQQQSPRSSVSADEGYATSIASTSEQEFYRQWLSGLEDTCLGKTKHTERSHRDRQRLQSNGTFTGTI